MKRYFIALALSFATAFSATTAFCQQPKFKVLAFYSTNVEADHVQFAMGAIKFFKELATKDNFAFDSTANWEDLTKPSLKQYQVVVWLNEFPHNDAERKGFQNYIENGGAWLGFHVSAFNDNGTHWPWLVKFLGGAVFDENSWPPLPAKLTVDDRYHPVMKGIPATFISPANEWYRWTPSPRLDKNVRVLVTLDPSNYPLGIKNILVGGDIPVVWTNTKYKMLYMNMGHGDKIFTSPVQNKMFENAILWLGMPAPQSHVPLSSPIGMQISPKAVVVDAKTNKVYAVNPGSDSVSVMDAATGSIHTIKVGTDPQALAVNPVTDRIYVTNGGSANVSVIDGASNNVIATLHVGDFPYTVAVNPVTNKIYVSNNFSNIVTVIDGATNSTTKLKATSADAIAVNSKTDKIYLLGYEDNGLRLLDGTTNAITHVMPGEVHHWSIAVNSATGKVYVTNAGSASLTVLDVTNNTTTRVKTGEIPCAVAVNPATNKIYVVNYGSNSVTVVGGLNNSVIATVDVGKQPHAVAINPATDRIYVANTHSNNLTVIDGASNSVVGTVPAGDAPYAVAVDTKFNKVYVTDMAGKRVTIIDANSIR